ncbi:MAG: hypothetical protein ACTS4Z_01090 [Candidatus Hodgkinia cicadicola]
MKLLKAAKESENIRSHVRCLWGNGRGQTLRGKRPFEKLLKQTEVVLKFITVYGNCYLMFELSI